MLLSFLIRRSKGRPLPPFVAKRWSNYLSIGFTEVVLAILYSFSRVIRSSSVLSSLVDYKEQSNAVYYRRSLVFLVLSVFNQLPTRISTLRSGIVPVRLFTTRQNFPGYQSPLSLRVEGSLQVGEDFFGLWHASSKDLLLIVILFQTTKIIFLLTRNPRARHAYLP